MKKALAILAATLVAAPAVAHETGGIFHLHPHGGETLLVGAVLAVAVGAWALARRR
jgi:hypothetical protein